MSMTTFMIWQMIGIFCAYFGVTLVLPLVVFRSLLKGRTITNQIVFSYLIGNFYIITMVQILQLLKISHTVTLILATVVPAYIAWVKLNKVVVGKKLETIGTNAKRVTNKHLGVKTVGVRISAIVWRKCKKLIKKLKTLVLSNWIEILLQTGLFLVLVWAYGRGIITTYGYSASDIPVHNYWINAMGNNNIFVAGVYPHGYHCMIYYLHKVFGIDTYILLSLFAFVQVTCIHFALLYFLKLCCKMEFIPYIGAVMFAAGNYFMSITYSRFASTLPQEFGMIFIFPCIYYGFEFFQLRYEEVKKEQKKADSWYSLFGFAMGFGITLSAHFYNTIAAGFFCVAMAIGYLFLFVKKQYFGNVVVTCFISVMVAILPMGLAFATGTPLEGSLYWARSVIVGAEESEEENTELDSEQQEQMTSADTANSGANEYVETDSQMDNSSMVENTTEQSQVVVSKSVKDRIKEFYANLKVKLLTINNAMKDCVWSENGEVRSKLFWLGIVILLIEGILCLIFRKTCYGAMLISIALYLFIMAIALSAGALGLLMLMDPARACIYFSYAIPILVTMPFDGFCYLATFCGRWKKIGKCLALGCLVVFCVQMVAKDNIRTAFKAGGFETNEAVTCLTNILRQEKDFMWTICSANDEFRMSEEHGYHYEVITFLQEMEGLSKESIVTIPTPKVFFFIEKVPLDYAVTYENSGQRISIEGAQRELCNSAGLAPYQGENRWITMSKMYCWAQEFQKMYPNEMKIYMENDNFVCYVLEQNTYNLLNLAIDYGYNTEE